MRHSHKTIFYIHSHNIQMQNVEHSHLNVWTNSHTMTEQSFCVKPSTFHFTIAWRHKYRSNRQITLLFIYVIASSTYVISINVINLPLVSCTSTCLQTRSFKWNGSQENRSPVLSNNYWFNKHVTYPNSKHYLLIMTPLLKLETYT